MKTIIIGAGPAGLNAAIHAKDNQNDVILLEKNEKAGKKLFITGKGRCNVTNDCTPEEFIQHVVNNPRFLYRAIHLFSSQDTMNFFNEHETPLVVERGNRVFPKSYHAYDITDALVKEARHKGVSFHFNVEVKSIQKKEDKFYLETNIGELTCDNVVIATGGLSYPTTGSTGDGYRFAEEFHHTIVKPVPALTGIEIQEKIPKELHGFTLRNITLHAEDGKFHKEEFGDLTFYDYLDGPIVLRLSSLINRRDNQNLKLYLDLKPALDQDKLEKRIDREIQDNPNQKVYMILNALLPKEMIPFFEQLTSFNDQGKVSSFSKDERRKLAYALKHLPFTFKALKGYDRAVVTSGGINTKEIDPKTMESKEVKGLYFAGEVMDVDALTGGFNIQIALSTGALAGDSIKEKEEENIC